MGFGPPGFLNAPASKLVTCGCAAATLAAHLLGVADDLALTPGAVARLHLPRVLASHVVFASPGEAVFGLYLLYHFRVFERQRGTRRYAVFAAVAAALAIAAQVATTALVGSFDPSGGSASSLAGTHRLLAPRRGRGGGGPPLLASGPHALIWAHVAPFRRDVPSAYHFTVFGVRFSDKAFVYLAAIQLALSRWPSGVAPSLVGLIVGYALDHRRRAPPRTSSSASRGGGTSSTGSASPTPLRWVDDWTPPLFVRRFIRATVGRALEGAAARSDSEEASSGTRDEPSSRGSGSGSSSSRRKRPIVRVRAAANGGGGGGGAGGGIGGGWAAAAGAAGAPVEVSQRQVDALAAMGFGEAEARRALAEGGGDLARATDILLG